MIGTRFRKDKYDVNAYAEAAIWCNLHNATIEDMGGWYEVVALPEPEPPTQEQIKKQLEIAVQNWLDSEAQKLNYDNLDSTAKYLFCDDPVFKAEAIAFSKWAGRVWRKCYDIVDEVVAGTRDIPTTEQLFAELPQLNIEYPEVSDVE